MRARWPLLTVLVASLSWASAAAPAGTSTTSTSTTAPPGTPGSLSCALADVATWTLTQVADETIVVPVEAGHVGAMGPAARDGYGGIILFGTTAPRAIASVLARLQTMTPHHSSMLVMTDEEGGGVMRLTNVVGAFPWAQVMGSTMTAARIRAIGERVGGQLLASGVNTDLAPVADLDGRHVYPGAADPDGYRSFSATPSIAAADATAFANGLAQAGVTAVEKHFPGLGGATRNTDQGPARTLAWSVLRTTALVPYEQAIAAGVPAVMVSNASVPGLTPLPASLSPAVVKELRGGLGFHGLVIDDALSAGAIVALHLGVAGASVRAIEAGVDLVLYGPPGSPASALGRAAAISAALVRAVDSGALARSTLDAAAAQVLATRTTLSCPAA
jgi:beta-N-acetylhexosaminidase